MQNQELQGITVITYRQRLCNYRVGLLTCIALYLTMTILTFYVEHITFNLSGNG